MKKLIIPLLFLLPFVFGCDKDNDVTYAEIREIAWNSLTSNEKSTVTADWQKAPVAETTYEGKDVYSVTFNTSADALLGPIMVYVDQDSLEVLGQALRM